MKAIYKGKVIAGIGESTADAWADAQEELQDARRALLADGWQEARIDSDLVGIWEYHQFQGCEMNFHIAGDLLVPADSFTEEQEDAIQAYETISEKMIGDYPADLDFELDDAQEGLDEAGVYWDGSYWGWSLYPGPAS